MTPKVVQECPWNGPRVNWATSSSPSNLVPPLPEGAQATSNLCLFHSLAAYGFGTVVGASPGHEKGLREGPVGTAWDSKCRSGSVLGTAPERDGRRRVDFVIYLTSAGPLTTQSASKRRPRNDPNSGPDTK